MLTSTRSRRSSEVPTVLPPVQEMLSSSTHPLSNLLIDVSQGGACSDRAFLSVRPIINLPPLLIPKTAINNPRRHVFMKT
eukprot:scaffold12110_cov58-Cyclotella_meneghiniana.AAC.5